MRKRKHNGCVETTQGPRGAKSRRTLVEDTKSSGNEDSGTLCPIYLGAKSGAGREPVDRRTKWAGFNGNNGGNSHGDDLNDQDKTNK